MVASFFPSALTASASASAADSAMLALMGVFIPVVSLIPVQRRRCNKPTAAGHGASANYPHGYRAAFLIGSIIGAVAGAFPSWCSAGVALLKIVLGVFIILITWVAMPGIGRIGRSGLAVVSSGVGALYDGRRDRPIVVSVLAWILAATWNAVGDLSGDHGRTACAEDQSSSACSVSSSVPWIWLVAAISPAAARHRLRRGYLTGSARRLQVLVHVAIHGSGAGPPAARHCGLGW